MDTKKINYTQAAINEKLARMNGTKSQSEVEASLTDLALNLTDLETTANDAKSSADSASTYCKTVKDALDSASTEDTNAAKIATNKAEFDSVIYADKECSLDVFAKYRYAPDGEVIIQLSTWSIHYCAITQGSNYKITVKNNGTSTTDVRIAYSENAPAKDGAITYLNSVTADTTINYTATSNGYILITCADTLYTDLTVSVDLIVNKIDEVVSDEDGINERIDTISNKLQNTITASVTKEITAKSSVIDLFLQGGKTYTITFKAEGFSSTRATNLNRICTANSSDTIVDDTLKALFGGSSKLFSGEEVSINYTASEDTIYIYVQFYSDFDDGESGTLTMTTSRVEDAYTNKPLTDKKVLMLGDSISQLPRTGTKNLGNGICEYFSEISGASVIRGAFGGSHIRARRIVEQSSDITDINYALATMDVCNIVAQLVAGDFTLAKAGQAWLKSSGDGTSNIDGLDVYKDKIISELESLDMSTIDIITIFAGTNDFNNGVALQADGETAETATNKSYENGAWNYILETLSTTYPNISIFVFSPIVKYMVHNVVGDWCEDVADSVSGLYLRDYVQNNIDAAKRFQCPSCDLYHEMGINKYNAYTYLSGDGTHPKDKGFRAIASKMAAFVVSHMNR